VHDTAVTLVYSGEKIVSRTCRWTACSAMEPISAP